MDLFTRTDGLIPIPIEDGRLAYQAQLPLSISCAEVLERLIAETPWRQEPITVWGKAHLQPRLTAWYGEARYRYSGLVMEPLPMTALLAEMRTAVERATGSRFNSVLLNYYRNERDSMGMHSDDEPELGPQPAIASLSFGEERVFLLKHKRTGQLLKRALGDGSLLFMSGDIQKNWLHGLNKSARKMGPRLNLTFRYVV